VSRQPALLLQQRAPRGERDVDRADRRRILGWGEALVLRIEERHRLRRVGVLRLVEHEQVLRALDLLLLEVVADLLGAVAGHHALGQVESPLGLLAVEVFDLARDGLEVVAEPGLLGDGRRLFEPGQPLELHDEQDRERREHRQEADPQRAALAQGPSGRR